jgi:hypothetical protein
MLRLDGEVFRLGTAIAVQAPQKPKCVLGRENALAVRLDGRAKQGAE